MWYSNDLLHYMFEAEFVTLSTLKVPSGTTATSLNPCTNAMHNGPCTTTHTHTQAKSVGVYGRALLPRGGDRGRRRRRRPRRRRRRSPQGRVPRGRVSTPPQEGSLRRTLPQRLRGGGAGSGRDRRATEEEVGYGRCKVRTGLFFSQLTIVFFFHYLSEPCLLNLGVETPIH